MGNTSRLTATDTLNTCPVGGGGFLVRPQYHLVPEAFQSHGLHSKGLAVYDRKFFIAT